MRIAHGTAPQEPGWQPAKVSDEDVRTFIGQFNTALNPIAATDAGLARVTEDLINILIDKGVIQFTDLPAAAQTKLLERRLVREQMSSRLTLLDDDELI